MRRAVPLLLLAAPFLGWLASLGDALAQAPAAQAPAAQTPVAKAQGAKPGVGRLVDSIEAPVAYLCLEAVPAGANGERQPGPVQRLLADPSLETLFTPAAASRSSSEAAADAGSARALALVRGVLGRSSGELEIVLTGIVPNGGQPLLVLRARLQNGEADQLQLALDRNELAEPSRRLGGNTTYRLRGGAKAVGPGQDVELALVGADLLVGNDTSALREVLEPPLPATTTVRARRVLSADPAFSAMKKQLPLAPGALWLYGDWARLGDRVGANVGGVPGWLMGSSGLGSARAVMASVSCEKSDFNATLLLDFAPEERRPPGPPLGDKPGDRPGRSGRNGPPPHERGGRDGLDGPGFPPRGPRGPGGIDGWFAAVEPVAARALLPELPSGGLGGLVLSVDLGSLTDRTHRLRHVLGDLDQAFHVYGLDFERTVLNRLGSRGTVQLHVGRGTDAVAEVESVYTVRTKNKKAAADLFADLRRVAEPARLATLSVHDSKDTRERRYELLEFRHREAPLFVTAHEDTLLLANTAEALVAVVDEVRRAKPRVRRAEPLTAAVAAIGNENVAGLFDIDLQPLFEQITAALTGGASTGAGARVDLSALPKRHVGYLDLQRRDDGTVVRVRVVSSR